MKNVEHYTNTTLVITSGVQNDQPN